MQIKIQTTNINIQTAKIKVQNSSNECTNDLCIIIKTITTARMFSVGAEGREGN